MSSDDNYSPPAVQRIRVLNQIPPTKCPVKSSSSVESDDACLGNTATLPAESKRHTKGKIINTKSKVSSKEKETKPTSARLVGKKGGKAGTKAIPVENMHVGSKSIHAETFASEYSASSEPVNETGACLGEASFAKLPPPIQTDAPSNTTGAEKTGEKEQTAGSHSSAVVAVEHVPSIPTTILPGSDDLRSLRVGGELLDGIMDYMLSRIFNGLSSEVQACTHIFSTAFWDQMWPSKNYATGTRKGRQNPALVASFTRNVNIFKKRFILIPIEDKRHWLLVIVYFPENDPDPKARSREPSIIQMDSSTADGMSDRKVIWNHLKTFLKAECRAKGAVYDIEKMKISYPIMPQQDNRTDCGIFLLEFVRLFFQEPCLDWARSGMAISHQLAPIDADIMRVKLYDAIMQDKIAEDPSFLDELGYIDLPVLTLPDPLAAAPRVEYPGEYDNRRQTRSRPKN